MSVSVNGHMPLSELAMLGCKWQQNSEEEWSNNAAVNERTNEWMEVWMARWLGWMKHERVKLAVQRSLWSLENIGPNAWHRIITFSKFPLLCFLLTFFQISPFIDIFLCHCWRTAVCRHTVFDQTKTKQTANVGEQPTDSHHFRL